MQRPTSYPRKRESKYRNLQQDSGERECSTRAQLTGRRLGIEFYLLPSETQAHDPRRHGADSPRDVEIEKAATGGDWGDAGQCEGSTGGETPANARLRGFGVAI